MRFLVVVRLLVWAIVVLLAAHAPGCTTAMPTSVPDVWPHVPAEDLDALEVPATAQA